MLQYQSIVDCRNLHQKAYWLLCSPQNLKYGINQPLRYNFYRPKAVDTCAHFPPASANLAHFHHDNFGTSK